MGQKPQHCFLMPILVGTDGVQKMSKSLGNYIGVEDNPNDMYGKVMSLPDGLMPQYFECLTDVPDGEMEEMREALEDGSVNPIELKKRLAMEITGQFHGPDDAREAEQYFERVVQRGEVPEGIEECRFPVLEGGSSTSNVIVKTFPAISRSEVKRLISQGAVERNGKKVYSENVAWNNGDIVKVGRRGFIKMVETDWMQK